MGKALDIDWTLGLALWLQGIPPKELAKQLGCKVDTLKAHAYRNGWVEQKQKVQQAVAERVEKVALKNLASVSQSIREQCAVDAQRVLDALAMKDPVGLSLPELELRERVAKSAQSRGFIACGLNDQPVSTAVNIQLMGSLNAQFEDMRKLTVDIPPEPQQVTDAKPNT